MVETFIACGFDIVYRAPHGAQDHIWYKEARSLGANVIISPDWDLDIMANNDGVKSVHITADKLRADPLRLYLWLVNQLDILFSEPVKESTLEHTRFGSDQTLDI